MTHTLEQKRTNVWNYAPALTPSERETMLNRHVSAPSLMRLTKVLSVISDKGLYISQPGSTLRGAWAIFDHPLDLHKYVHFDAINNRTTPETVNINDYLPEDNSCNYLIFLFNNDDKYPTLDNLENLKVTTDGNGNKRCWINATLYAVLFGIMNKKGKEEKEGEEEEEDGKKEK